MEQIFQYLESLIEPVVVIVLLVIILLLNKWVFDRLKSTSSKANITRSTIAFLLVLIGILAFILSLPIDQALKGQILSFLAILISAGIALSSTTVLGNIIAGIMNNSMNRFRSGDLIKLDDFHGRVTKKSIFHTEIQLEDSNFITIPNLYIASNPVKLIRKSDTVISTSISLGYDVPRSRIEEALKEAANVAGLKDPYVYITELGDFSVVYKIHGFLDDSNKFFSTNSLLNASVMDALHEKRIEIVSPTFMNQRRVDEREFIPEQEAKEAEPDKKETPEELVFDEAIKSEKLEKKKDFLQKMEKEKSQLKDELREVKDEEEVERIKSSIDRLDELKEQIEESIRDSEEGEE